MNEYFILHSVIFSIENFLPGSVLLNSFWNSESQTKKRETQKVSLLPNIRLCLSFVSKVPGGGHSL